MHEDALDPEADANSKMITRKEAAKLLDTNERGVRHLESKGLLRPSGSRKGARGKPQVLYNIAHVQDARYGGKEAGEVYRAISAGKSPITIIEELNLHPDVVETIIRSRARLEGGLFLNGAQMDVINALPLDGVFPIVSGEALVAVMQAAADTTVMCKMCKKKPRTICRGCAVETVRRLRNG